MCVSIDLSKLIIVAIFIVLLTAISVIIIPELIYNNVKNEKVEKFLEYDLVKTCWVLLTVVIDTLLIIGFVDIIF